MQTNGAVKDYKFNLGKRSLTGEAAVIGDIISSNYSGNIADPLYTALDSTIVEVRGRNSLPTGNVDAVLLDNNYKQLVLGVFNEKLSDALQQDTLLGSRPHSHI
jgi:hypothetical protein